MKFTTIIVFLIPLVVARHHHRTLLETILKSKGNFFTSVNEEVQSFMNSIFDLLNLSSTFLTKGRIKLLLTMYYDLNVISERNFDAYSEMKNVTRIDTENKPSNKIELYELIEEIFNDKHFNLSAIIAEKNHTRKHTKHKFSRNITKSELGDSKEFKEFIQDFKNKIDKLSVNDFSNQSSPEWSPDNINDINLEVWQPPAILELDFVNDTEGRRIYRGARTRVKIYPFVVSVHLMGVFACAGSIISSDLIITAASCLQLLYNNRFYRENPRSVFVRVGSDYHYRGGEKIDVIETYFHPSYDPKTLKNNLLILRLQKLIKFLRKQKSIRRIVFDRRPSHLPSNTNGILILGWGSKKSTSIMNEFQRLMVSELEVYPIEECSEIYSKHYVTSKHFCAGFMATGGGACNRDVGGPGVVSGELVGIVSFGPPVCGTVDAPTVFTKVGFYAKWILSIMRMQPPVIGVRTTLLPRKLPRHPIYVPKRPKQQQVKPINEDELFEGHPEGLPEATDVLTLKDVLAELAHSNNDLLQDLLYGDLSDIDSIFKPSDAPNIMNHPLLNKSLFMIPEIHTSTTPSNYVTIPASVSTTPLSTTPRTTRTTRTTVTTTQTTEETPMESYESKQFVNYDDTDDYEFTTTRNTRTTRKSIKIHHPRRHHHQQRHKMYKPRETDQKKKASADAYGDDSAPITPVNVEDKHSEDYPTNVAAY